MTYDVLMIRLLESGVMALVVLAALFFAGVMLKSIIEFFIEIFSNDR